MKNIQTKIFIVLIICMCVSSLANTINVANKSKKDVFVEATSQKGTTSITVVHDSTKALKANGCAQKIVFYSSSEGKIEKISRGTFKAKQKNRCKSKSFTITGDTTLTISADQETSDSTEVE